MAEAAGQVAARRRATKRDDILDAAIAIIGERGTAAITHRAVADRANTAVGSITYHFATTEGLLAAALQRAGDRERARVQAAQPKQIDDVDGWVQGLTAHLVVAGPADRDRKIAAFELMLAAARDPSLRPDLASWQSDYLAWTQAAVTEAGARDPEAATVVIASALLGLDLAQLAMGGLPEDILGQMIRAVIEAVVSRPEPH